ncbi:MAG TPA: hypothetical protein VML94_08335 [Thermoplasmata archaeon]|nr:hypothetical protein [Thermoplasmata archaeon]
MAFFAVVNEQGPAWVEGRPMREQVGWSEHAAFVNGLVRAGVILIAGPLGTGPPHVALLFVHSESEDEVRRRLLEDPWMGSGVLRIRSVESWAVLASDDRLDRVLAEIIGTAP